MEEPPSNLGVEDEGESGRRSNQGRGYMCMHNKLSDGVKTPRRPRASRSLSRKERANLVFEEYPFSELPINL